MSQSEPSSDNVCEVCGRSFDTMNGLNSHVGHAHPGLRTVQIECEMCGEIFELKRSNADLRRTCSTECGNKLKRQMADEMQIYDLNGNETALVQFGICPICKDDFADAHAVKSHVHRLHGYSIAQKQLTCERCGEEYVLKNWEFNSNGGSRFCSLECKAQVVTPSGEDHWNYGNFGSMSHQWVGGKNYINAIRKCLGPRPWLEITTDYRSKIGKCELCGDSDCRLETHHIVPVSAGGTNGEYNLMALCAVCHKKAEYYTADLFDAVYIE